MRNNLYPFYLGLSEQHAVKRIIMKQFKGVCSRCIRRSQGKLTDSDRNKLATSRLAAERNPIRMLRVLERNLRN